MGDGLLTTLKKRASSAVRAAGSRASGLLRKASDTGLPDWLWAAFRRNRLLAWGALLAALCGMTGYLAAGLSPFSAVYAAAALFFVNPVTDAENLLITLAKYLALAVASGVILRVASYAFRAAGHYRINRYGDSTAVYTDTAWGERLAASMPHGYVGRERGGRLEGAKHHIFLYADDLANLNLYAAHRAELEDRRAYVMLNGVDAFLLKGGPAGASEGPRYFSLYDMMARLYWREHDLYSAACAGTGPCRVAIVGYGPVGRAICKYALLNNVYRLKQEIEYHVWGCSVHQGAVLSSMRLMNRDRLVVHEGACGDSPADLAAMDRIILTEPEDLDLLQEALYAAPDAEIHCYRDGQTDAAALYSHPGGALCSFGDWKDILTGETIKEEPLYRQAKLLHYDYTLRTGGRSAEALPADYRREMEMAWRGLSGFQKGSNISRADHLWVEQRLEQDGLAEEIAPLEHVRWCRYHFWNRWSFAPERDDLHRRHNLLTDALPPADAAKDGIYNARIRSLLLREGGKRRHSSREI